MAKYPETQRKAQAELDAVIGPHRLPEFSDRPSLPYVNALLKETMRWRWQLVVPLAVAHMATDDDFYEGYFIPKGSIVLGYEWAMLHDERVYSTLHSFNITPALDEKGVLMPLSKDMTSRLISYPEPFKVHIKPRSSATETLVRDGVLGEN